MYFWGHTLMGGSVPKQFYICSDVRFSPEMMSLSTFNFQHLPHPPDSRPGFHEDRLGIGLRACLHSSLLPNPGLLWMARSPRKILRPHKAALAGPPRWAARQAQMPGSAGRPDAHMIIHHLLGDHHGSPGLLFSKLNNPISYNCLPPNCLCPVLLL